MSDSSQILAEEAWHTEYSVFLFTLKALSRPPVEQCELMGDFNTAWELRDDALCGRYLLGSGFFTEQQEAAVIEFLTAVDPVPVNDMPSGAGREANLAAMQHPAWQPSGRKAFCNYVARKPNSLASVSAAIRSGCRHVASSFKSVWRANTSQALR